MNSPKKHWLDAWHVNPSASKDYDFIDGLRGIAILMVIACHLFYVNPQSGGWVRFIGGVFTAGAFGVTVFFTLSGFLIAYPFWRRKVKGAAQLVPPGYGWRRYWKIYPPLALSILILAPIYLLRSNDWSFVTVALQWLVGWPLVQPVSSQLNPVMWSLLVEVQFYVVLPLLFLGLRRLPARTCLWLLPLVFLILPAGWRWLNYSRGIYLTLHPQIDFRFPSLLDAFALGILLAGMENLGMLRKSWARLGDVGLVLLALALPAISCANLHQMGDPHLREEFFGWVVRIASACLLCYIANPQHPRVRMLSQPWLRWCGIISYEWYLFHQPVILWARASFGPAGGNASKYGAIALGSLLIGLILAALVYRHFSLPILQYGRDKHRH